MILCLNVKHAFDEFRHTRDVLEVLNPLLLIQEEILLPLKVQLDFHHLPLQASPVCN